MRKASYFLVLFSVFLASFEIQAQELTTVTTSVIHGTIAGKDRLKIQGGYKEVGIRDPRGVCMTEDCYSTCDYTVIAPIADELKQPFRSEDLLSGGLDADESQCTPIQAQWLSSLPNGSLSYTLTTYDTQSYEKQNGTCYLHHDYWQSFSIDGVGRFNESAEIKPAISSADEVDSARCATEPTAPKNVSKEVARGQGALDSPAQIPVDVVVRTTDYDSTFGDTVICEFGMKATINGLTTNYGLIFPKRYCEGNVDCNHCDEAGGQALLRQWRGSVNEAHLPYHYEQDTYVYYNNSGDREAQQHCQQITRVETTAPLADGSQLKAMTYKPEVEVPNSYCH